MTKAVRYEIGENEWVELYDPSDQSHRSVAAAVERLKGFTVGKTPEAEMDQWLRDRIAAWHLVDTDPGKRAKSRRRVTRGRDDHELRPRRPTRNDHAQADEGRRRMSPDFYTDLDAALSDCTALIAPTAIERLTEALRGVDTLLGPLDALKERLS